jgi:hypothetical protein
VKVRLFINFKLEIIMITLETFQKHIIFYCKGHYHIPDTHKGFFEGLKMIWAIRCGYDYKHTGKDTLTYIANDMYEIIATCMPKRLPYLMDTLHREINPFSSYGKPQDMSPIEAIIWEYRSMLSNMQIRKKPEGKKRYVWLVKIDKPQKQLFNKILKGLGNCEDYYKVK